MSKFLDFIKSLAPKSQRQLDEAYLARSTNIYDLERRMRELQGHMQPGVYGLTLLYSAFSAR